MKSRGLFNAFELKCIMLVLMALDHMYYYLFPGELLFAHYLARVVAPVFTFFMTESMVYTRDRLGYILRLFLSGMVMSAGNMIITRITGISITNNIFMSLGIGASLIYCIDKTSGKKYVIFWIPISIVCILASFYCEGQYIVPLMAVIFYYLRNEPFKMHVVYVALTGITFFIVYLTTRVIQPQAYMVFAFFPIMIYDGRRGLNSAFAKYLFYIFYPLHIWIIVFTKFLFKV